MKTNVQKTGVPDVRISNVQGLIKNALAEAKDQSVLERTAEQFAIGLTPHLVSLIRATGSKALTRQYLPDARELKITPDEISDPIGDHDHSPVKGIVHRYPDRVLFKAVNVCAVYCRFCFRREMIGPGSEKLSEFELERALHYIRETPQIHEVILTGGDPLVLSPAQLEKIFQKLASIEHVQTIRIHTRIPVADPPRINKRMLDVLKNVQKPLYIAIHTNHADEFSESVRVTLKTLHETGAVLLGQTVLLKGVNDSAEALTDLFRSMIDNRIKPYELHHPDKTKGTSHFRLPIARGLELYAELRGTISGLCLPHYMLDLPGGHGKVEVNTLQKIANGRYKAVNFQGKDFIYDD